MPSQEPCHWPLGLRRAAAEELCDLRLDQPGVFLKATRMELQRSCSSQTRAPPLVRGSEAHGQWGAGWTSPTLPVVALGFAHGLAASP